MKKTRTLLLIDESPDDTTLAALHLSRNPDDIVVEKVSDPIAFAEHLARGGFVGVITEYVLSWGNGLRVLEAVKARWPHCPVILFTAELKPEMLSEGLRLGLDGFLPKTSSGFLRLSSTVFRLLDREPSRRRGGEPRFQRAIAGLATGLFRGTKVTGMMEANPAMARILGVSGPEELKGRDLMDFMVTEEGREKWRDAMDSGRSLENVAITLSGGPEHTSWVRLSVWVSEDPVTGACMYEGMAEDVSGWKHAEEELSRREEALKKSNAELKQFSYVVSHDLHEPLQLVSRYAKLLLDRYGGKVDREADRFLYHLMESAQRMQERIDNVLEYATLGAKGLKLVPVSFSGLIDEALENLRTLVEDTGARVTYENLPTVNADRSQMLQLFENLIGNALKFRGDSPVRIHITASKQDDGWLFSVQDNGIGIDPAQRDRIFGMFQRLHTKAEYPGTGIGLAICKKIVEQHHGKIWAESEPGKGSRFLFLLPEKVAPEKMERIAEANG